jgi:oxygen-dependent protoporphyrinogen oxidase
MRALILGGGITGLSAAWFLKKKNPNAEITLLEKSDRVGGWIRTDREGDFLFEKGPRTFPLGRCPLLLEMMQELRLNILYAKPQKRYLWKKGKLHSLGSQLPWLLPYLLREPFVKKSIVEDESIYDFAVRRFGVKVAEEIFDPMTLGIYAGDMRKLSIRSCFPSLFSAEREKGSVLKAFFGVKSQGLFTLEAGMESLVEALKKGIDIVTQCKVEAIGKNEVTAGGKIWKADRILSALPPQLPAKSIWVVNVGFNREVLQKRGYGYLIPTREGQSVLGVIWDSSIFPLQGQTKMTVMLREEEKNPLEAALQHLSLGKPDQASVFFAEKAIPQMEVGCSYFEGISVEACIERGKKLAD